VGAVTRGSAVRAASRCAENAANTPITVEPGAAGGWNGYQGKTAIPLDLGGQQARRAGVAPKDLKGRGQTGLAAGEGASVMAECGPPHSVRPTIRR